MYSLLSNPVSHLVLTEGSTTSKTVHKDFKGQLFLLLPDSSTCPKLLD
jgi:hypothetical protein